MFGIWCLTSSIELVISSMLAGGWGDTAAINNNVQEANLLFWTKQLNYVRNVNKDNLETVPNISKKTLIF